MSSTTGGFAHSGNQDTLMFVSPVLNTSNYMHYVLVCSCGGGISGMANFKFGVTIKPCATWSTKALPAAKIACTFCVS